MTWSEHWPIADSDADPDAHAVAALVEDALAARELPVGAAIVHEDGSLEGVYIESYGRYLTIAIGAGDLRGAFTLARRDGEEAAYAELNSDEVRGPWEPLYRLFAELALALGAAQEPTLAIEPDPALGAEALREELRGAVGACVSDAMYADGLDAEEAEITDGGEAPLDADELDVEIRADAVVVRVTGAGARFTVTVRGLAAGLTPDGRAALDRALRADVPPCIAAHRWLRHQRAAPPAAPARGGQLVLERREGGRLVSAEELTDLAALRAALAQGDADAIRYFADGAPFWKASYERGHALDAAITSLDALHADRTWQWDAAAASAPLDAA